MGDNIIFLIPIVTVLTIGMIVTFSPLAKVLAQRLSRSVGPGEEELLQITKEQSARLDAAEDQIESLQERLDFTEKLLQDRPASTAQLPSSSGSGPSQG